MDTKRLITNVVNRIVGSVKNPSYALMRLKIFLLGMKVKKPEGNSTVYHKRLFMSGFCFLPDVSFIEVCELKTFFFGAHGVNESEYMLSAKKARLIRSEGLYSSGGEDCPMAKVARSKAVIELASDFLGIPQSNLYFSANIDVSPVVNSNEIRNPDGADAAFRFHRDADSYNFIKAFIYLNDVSSDGAGQHELFEGSALGLKMPWALRLFKRYTLEQIEKHIPTSIHTPIFGKAGTFFVENTTGFHRGSHAVKSPRIMLSLSFGSKDYFNRYSHHVHKVIAS